MHVEVKTQHFCPSPNAVPNLVHIRNLRTTFEIRPKGGSTNWTRVPYFKFCRKDQRTDITESFLILRRI
jgi:hypothetical protein